MKYTVYQITNKINGKIYIGSHKTKNLNDGYMGSGKYLKYSQNKHGLDQFEKKILFIFDNPEDMYAKEAEIVNVDFIAEKNTYNLKLGGFGGWDHINNDVEKRIAKNQRARAIANENGAMEKHQAHYQAIRDQYNLDPKLCFECGEPIPHLKRKNKFCGSSCSATHNNSRRILKRNMPG